MNKQATLLAATAALLLTLTGCSSSRSVRAESNPSETALHQDDTYSIEFTEAGKRSVEFSPREQDSAKQTLALALEDKGLAPAASASKADYIVRFDTYTETEDSSFAASFPQRDVQVYSSSRGISTPLGSVPTHRETHVVDRGYTFTAGGGERTDRYFVVDIVDPKSDTIIWRGYTRRGSERLNTKRLNSEIEKIIKKLPVRKKPQEQEEII